MGTPDSIEAKAFAKFVEMGEGRVRAALDNNVLATERPYAKRWLHILEESRQAATRLTESRFLKAAEDSATAATRSARWAGFAVIVSIAALLVASWPFISKFWE